jgi:hypothetical protein
MGEGGVFIMTIRKKMALPAAAALLVLGLMVIAQSATATHVRPKAATPFYASTVPAYQPCTTPNRTHAAPLTYGSCNPPVQSSTSLTVGTPDANSAVANSVGFIRMVVTNGPLANDADVAIVSQITDVRCKAGVTACNPTANSLDGPDYSGGLQATASWNITDHNNAAGCPASCGPYTDAATGTWPSFPVVMACAPNSDATIGAQCNVSTTANSISSGAIVENKRAVVEVSQLQVFDGGTDGNVASAPNTLFETQGIFIP